MHPLLRRCCMNSVTTYKAANGPIQLPTCACARQLRGSSMRRAIKAVLRREGWRGLYSGVGAVALGAGCLSTYPALALLHDVDARDLAYMSYISG